MRKSIPFDKTDVQTRINELEKLGTLQNRGELWRALGSHYGVSVATVAKWANGLEVKTPLGKLGRPKEIVKKQRGMNLIAANKILAGLPSYTTDQVRAKVGMLCEKAAAGSIKASAQLRCLDCVNYQIDEMRACNQAHSCSLHHIRPYKGSAQKG